jgi:hypothetical protein
LPIGVHGEERIPRKCGIEVCDGVGSIQRAVGGTGANRRADEQIVIAFQIVGTAANENVVSYQSANTIVGELLIDGADEALAAGGDAIRAVGGEQLRRTDPLKV